jgi:hypothetical protein
VTEFREEPEPDDEQAEDESPEADAEEVSDWSKHASGTLFERLEPLLAECALTEITGGPVQVMHAPLLQLLAHLCSESPTTSVLIEFPSDSTAPNRSWEDLPELEVQQRDSQWRFCFEVPSHWWFHEETREDLESHEISRALGTPPDGTQIEFTFVVKGLAEKCHRYTGSYRNQVLELERAYPAVTADVLSDALDLVEQVFGEHSIAFNSEDDEEAVRRDYHRSQGEVPRIRNGKIMPGPGSRAGVIQTLLFGRFEDRGPWDIAGARKLVEDDWELYEQITNPGDDEEEDDDEPLDAESAEELERFNTMLQQMNEAAELMNKAKVVPHGEEVVYQGRTGNFLKASMADLKHVPQDHLAEHDATMVKLGLRPIGDFVGDADQRQEITRCYVGQHALGLRGQRNEDNQFGWADVSNGAVLVDFSHGTSEFHTHFEDGTTLVTTSIDALHSKPEAGVYVRAYEDVTVARLWEKHLDGITRFEEYKETMALDHTRFSQPEKFLAMMDALFCRIMGVE